MVDLKDNLDEAVEEVREEFDEKYEELQKRIAEERAKAEAELDRLKDDAEGFFKRNKVWIYIAAGVVGAVIVAALLL